MMSANLAIMARKLEDAFFAEHDRKLVEEARQARRHQRRRESLAEASGIRDEAALEPLARLGVEPETIEAVSLVPLIEVSWADGSIDARERAAIVAVAEAMGIARESSAHGVLEEWLRKHPGPEMFEAWTSYVRALLGTLPKAAAVALRNDLMHRATAVAEAAGGFWGIGGKISREEKRALEAIRGALFGQRTDLPREGAF